MIFNLSSKIFQQQIIKFINIYYSNSNSFEFEFENLIYYRKKIMLKLLLNLKIILICLLNNIFNYKILSTLRLLKPKSKVCSTV